MVCTNRPSRFASPIPSDHLFQQTGNHRHRDGRKQRRVDGKLVLVWLRNESQRAMSQIQLG
jgi:hypothetical protein